MDKLTLERLRKHDLTDSEWQNSIVAMGEVSRMEGFNKMSDEDKELWWLAWINKLEEWSRKDDQDAK